MIVRKYYEQIEAQNMDNLSKMDTFLETYYRPNLNKESSGNLNRLMTNDEIEIVIKKFPANIGLHRFF